MTVCVTCPRVRLAHSARLACMYVCMYVRMYVLRRHLLSCPVLSCSCLQVCVLPLATLTSTSRLTSPCSVCRQVIPPARWPTLGRRLTSPCSFSRQVIPPARWRTLGRRRQPPARPPSAARARRTAPPVSALSAAPVSARSGAPVWSLAVAPIWSRSAAPVRRERSTPAQRTRTRRAARPSAASPPTSVWLRRWPGERGGSGRLPYTSPRGCRTCHRQLCDMTRPVHFTLQIWTVKYACAR